MPLLYIFSSIIFTFYKIILSLFMNYLPIRILYSFLLGLPGIYYRGFVFALVYMRLFMMY